MTTLSFWLHTDAFFLRFFTPLFFPLVGFVGNLIEKWEGPRVKKSFSFCEVTTYEHPYLYYVYKNTFNRKEKREFMLDNARGIIDKP